MSLIEKASTKLVLNKRNLKQSPLKSNSEQSEPIFDALPLLTPEAAAYVATPVSTKVFSADQVSPVDLLGDAVDAAVLAELLAHKGTQTPVALGLFGGPGSGKSTFLNLILDRVQSLSAASEKTAGGPFLAKIVVARTQLRGDSSPAEAVARSVYQALAGSGFGGLVDEAQYAGRDPQSVAREAQDALGETRQRLDTERQALHELNGRNARLADTVLFESAGSRVDAYARKIRGLLEPRLRGFGFDAAEPLNTFKTLVRDVAESRGLFPRLGGFLRSLWAFKGQTKLLVGAALSLALGWLAGFGIKTQASWTASLQNWPESLQPLAKFLIDHADWLHNLQAGFLGLTILFAVWNAWRAIRFFMPISHGVGLLRSDVVSRKRDIDGLLAHQTQRVNALAQEVDQASKRATEAQSRARAVRPSASGQVPDFALANSQNDAALEFLAAVNNLVSGHETAKGKANVALPDRIVVSFDGFDHLSPEMQSQFEHELRNVLSGSAFASVLSVGHSSLGAASLNRLVQIPYDLAQRGTGREQSLLVGSMLEPEPKHEMIAIDPKVSVFDAPLAQHEAQLLNILATWIGPSPRNVKRFVNLYRIARALEPDNSSCIAFALALQLGGTAEEKSAFEAGLSGYESGDVPEFSGRLWHYVTAARKSAGGLSVSAIRRAMALARRFSSN